MTLGQIAFLGSGETSRAGGAIFELIARSLPDQPRIAVLETPAGFELNSNQVAGRVADFLRSRLQNYNPVIDVIPARKRGSPFSPDEPALLKPLASANFIFMGPGSPTYAIRQLQGSLAWDLIRARHRRGAALAFASSATIAVGAWALPVYEIYKVGEDVYSARGLDLFSDFGMQLSFIPHWNNAEGGDDVDTSRCFVGMERFAVWCNSLPPENTTVGLDEHTGLIIDFEKRTCLVNGVSSVSLVRDCDPRIYPAGATFPLSELGALHPPERVDFGIPPRAWELASGVSQPADAGPGLDVLALAEQRRRARSNSDWGESDRLREEIASLGWNVQDTKDGQQLVRR
jgi:hypothetical protein